MPTIQISSNDLLNAVRQMPSEEFDAFLEQVLSLRTQPKADTLSAEETKLIERINCGLPVELCKRHAQLTRRRKQGRLTEEQYQQLLELTHQAESRDADRALALFELATLRRLTVRILMKQMGIEATPIRCDPPNV